MPKVTPTPIEALATALPDPNDPATYGPRGRAFWSWEVNQLANGANTLANQTLQNAEHAEEMANTAEAAAYLQGDWSAQTGAATRPYSVYHNGSFWALRNNLANVALSEPGVTADWSEMNGVKRGGDTMTGDLTVPSLNGGPLGGFRNRIINGDHQIQQAGVSFTGPANEAYLSDMWVLKKSGSYVNDITLGNTVTALQDQGIYSALYSQITTAVASPSSTNFLAYEARIEGPSMLDLFGQTFVVSFWVRAAVAGIYCLSLSSGNSARSRVQEYTINAANTWEFKSVVVTGGLGGRGSGDGWPSSPVASTGLRVRLCVSSGTTLQTTAGTWQTGNFYATSNQVNGAGAVSNNFDFSGVQLERGSVATPFEQVPYGTRLALCQRYYEIAAFRLQTYMTAGAAFGGTCYFKVSKANVPTVTLSGTTFTNASSAVTSGPSTTEAVGVFATATAAALCNVTTTVTANARLN